jgi:hypothetical protein
LKFKTTSPAAAPPRAHEAHRHAPKAPPPHYVPPRATQAQSKPAPNQRPTHARVNGVAALTPPARDTRPARPDLLNTKAVVANTPRAVQPKHAAPTPFTPRRANVPAEASRPKVNAVQLKTNQAPRDVRAPTVRATPARPRVIQALKFYPNLHPGAVERVEQGSLFRLENFTDQYRLRKAGGHGAYVPNQLYNFVRTSAGEMLMHNRYRHPSIAEGRQVLYAGEAFFNNGRLEWWSNGSGHYQPDSEDAAQAALPLDNFYTYQQVIKGEHKRRKG